MVIRYWDTEDGDGSRRMKDRAEKGAANPYGHPHYDTVGSREISQIIRLSGSAVKFVLISV
jgi:hypothetical protein